MWAVSCFVAATVASGSVDTIPAGRLGTQADSFGVVAARRVEELLADIQDPDEGMRLIEYLGWLEERPWELNSVTRGQLSTVPGLSPSEVGQILELRCRVGRFRSFQQISRELQSVPGTLEKVLPFACIDDTMARAAHAGRSLRLRARLSRESRVGDQAEPFPGSPVKTYTRLTLRDPGILDAGCLQSKDAGEQFSNGFVSGYLQIRDPSATSSVLIGDYRFESGQGLVFGDSPRWMGGQEAVAAVCRSPTGLRPHVSTDEFNYLRGAAVELSIPGKAGAGAAFLFSQRQLNATLDRQGRVVSFYRQSVFRTRAESQKRGRAHESLLGMAITSRLLSWMEGGISLYCARFNREVILEDLPPDVTHELALGSIHLRATVGPAIVFGEAARRSGRGDALTGGAAAQVGERAEIAITHTTCSRGFFNLHGASQGLSGWSLGRRESSVAWAVRSGAGLRLSCVAELFDRPALDLIEGARACGHEVRAEVDIRATDRIRLSARFSGTKTESAETIQDPLGRDVRVTLQRRQQRLRTTVRFHPNRVVTLVTRGELCRTVYSSPGGREQGYVLMHDVQIRAGSVLRLDARLLFVHTSSYDARLYELERDLPGVFTSPPLYGRGIRWYALVTCALSDRFRAAVKIAQTCMEPKLNHFLNRPDPSSGRATEAGAQVDVTL